jgi:hypothetical protein
MPSKLTGVDRRLRWGDFKSVATPPAGVPPGAAAQTIPLHTATGGTAHNVGPAGLTPFFEIPDTLIINVSLSRDSWRLDSVSNWSGTDQVWLINHEQGHYDIYALLVRDFFVRIQGMIGQPFTDAAELREIILDHRAATIGRIAGVQQDYDDDTANSRNGGEQWNWSCAIQRAKQLHRMPLVAGPDGRYLRVELLDELKSAGLAA